MKHYFKQIIKTPMLILFIIMVCIFSFPALSQVAEINQYAIVTALGIDTIDEGVNKYEISFLTFIPIAQQGFAERYKVVTAKGRNVSEALDFAGIQLGRQVGLSHLKMVVLNQELLNNDITVFLDYLIRNEGLNSTVKLVATNKSAQDFLKSAQKLDSDSSIKVSELVSFNDDYIYATDSSLESFYKGTLGPTKVSMIAFLPTEEQSQSTAAGSKDGENGESQGSGSGGSSENVTEDIKNNGDTVVFKNGKAVLYLNGLDMKKINLACGGFNTGSLEIRNVTDNQFENANLTFEIFNQQHLLQVAYQNGIPVISINVKLTLRLSEVENEGKIFQENIEFFDLSEETEKNIKKKIKKVLSQGIEIMKENQVDIADFYTFLNNHDYIKFHKFLNSLQNPDDYINHLIFKTSVFVNFG